MLIGTSWEPLSFLQPRKLHHQVSWSSLTSHRCHLLVFCSSSLRKLLGTSQTQWETCFAIVFSSFFILFLGMAGDTSCAGEITELVQTLLSFCVAMWCPLMRAGIWPPQPFRDPLLFVTPSGLQSCQLSLKHASSSMKFKKRPVCKVMPESLRLSRDKDSYTHDVRVHQSVVKESLNIALYVNAYTKHLPARQQLLKLFLPLPIPAQSVSAGAGPQLPSTAQLSNAVLRLHTYFLTEIPSLILSFANKHYCKIAWRFTQFLWNGLDHRWASGCAMYSQLYLKTAITLPKDRN